MLVRTHGEYGLQQQLVLIACDAVVVMLAL